MIEDLDISDLQRLSRETKQQSIRTVYANLEQGSKNHLRAFTAQLRSFGVKYRPIPISEEDFVTIVK